MNGVHGQILGLHGPILNQAISGIGGVIDKLKCKGKNQLGQILGVHGQILGVHGQMLRVWAHVCSVGTQ